MAFELTYKTESDIPSEVKHLYRKNGEEWSVVKSHEVKSQDDIDRLQEALRKEREDHKTVKDKLNKFNGMDAEEVLKKLDRIEELELAAKDKIDDEKINQIVESRIKSRIAPLERQLSEADKQKGEFEAQINEFKGKESRRSIHDAVRQAALEAKVRESAVEDAFFLAERLFHVDESTGKVITKDNVGVTPGIDPSVWLTEIKDKRPHWWPESKGAGATGGQGGAPGTNPFSHDGWNLTEQGKLMRQDPVKAQQMAASAGATIGGSRPPKAS